MNIKKIEYKKIFYLLFVVFYIFSMNMIFASGDSEDSGDDSSDSDYEYESDDEDYDYGYGEEQEAYNDAAADIFNGNGDNYTDEELVDMQQDAEDNGDYGIADYIGGYLDDRNDDEDEDDSGSFASLVSIKDVEDVIAKAHHEYERYNEDPELDCIEAANLLEQMGGREVVEDLNEYYWSSYEIGDPVMIVSGYFSHAEVDIKNEKGFEIFSRKYQQENESETLLGNKWQSNLDTRLIFGFVDISDDAINKLEEIKNNIKEQVDVLKDIIENNDSEDEVYEAYEDINNKFKEVNDRYMMALNVKRKSDNNINRNRYSFYTGMNKENFYMSCDNIVCFDYGVPYIFIPMEDNKKNYESKLSKSKKLKIIKDNDVMSMISQIVSVIIRDEEKIELTRQNEDYFLLEDNGNVKKYFNYYGLLTSVSVLGGEGFRIKRNTDGKILSLVDTHNRKFLFEFENNIIKRIYDEYGNNYLYEYEKNNNKMLLSSCKKENFGEVKYEYDDELDLVKIFQSDGSFVEISYKNYLKDGKSVKCVDSVKDEDGNPEYFKYDFINKVTYHTDRDGIETILKYDLNYKLIEKRIENNNPQYYIYDNEGKLTSYNEYDFEVNYIYDDNGNVINIFDSFNKNESYKYNSNNRIIEKIDSDGVVEKISYDSFGNCIRRSINDLNVYEAKYDAKNGFKTYEEVNGLKKYFFYDENNYLIEVKVENDGKFETFEKYSVDNIGRIVSKILATGIEINIQYKNKEVIKTFSNGLEQIYKYNIRNDLIELIETDLITNTKRITKYEYDKRHNLTKIIYEDKFIKFFYTPEGLLKKIETYDENELWSEEYKYDSRGKMIECKKNKFNFETNSYDSDVFIETFVYKEENLFYEIEKYINNIFVESRKFQRNGLVIQRKNGCEEMFSKNYSDAGRLLSEDTKYGGEKSYSYDTYGNLLSLKINDELIEKYTYNIDGFISEVTDGLNNTTKYFYDDLGNLSKIISGGCSIEYEYDIASRLVGIYYGSKTNAERFLCFEYDKNNREVIINEGGLYRTRVLLNSWGNIVEVVNDEMVSIKNEYDSNGNLKLFYDGYDNCTSYKYNCMNLLSEIIYPDNRIINYEYNVLGKVKKIKCGDIILWEGEYNLNGDLIFEKKIGDVKREYKYDEVGRLLEKKKGNLIEGKYFYNNYGKNILFVDGMGNKYQYEKNTNGNIIKEVNRLNNEKFYEYDIKNMLIKETDFNGKEIKIQYDYNELTKKYMFDDENIVHKYNMFEKIILVKNELGEIRYEYNKAGKLVSVYDVACDEKIYYRYDDAGRLVSIISSDRFVMYEYGKNNEIKRIYDEKQDMLVELDYDNCGREILRRFGNGINIETNYDFLGRVSYILEKNKFGNVLWSEKYIYNSDGKIEKIIDSDENNIIYEYDLAGRIIEVNYFRNNENWFEKFSYDNNGNRIMETNPLEEVYYEYDAENRMVKKGDINYLYDKNNNLIEKKSSSVSEKYFYNSLNFLTNYILLNEKNNTYDSVCFSYDGFGRRTIVQENGKNSMRTIYNGLTMEPFVERTMLSNGNVSSINLNSVINEIADDEVSRYMYLGLDNDSKNKSTRTKKLNENYFPHFFGKRFYLHLFGNPVAVNKISTNNWKETINNLLDDSMVSGSFIEKLDGINYFSTDIRGSVKNISDESGKVYCGFDYKVFGSPYLNDETFYNASEKNILGKIILEAMGVSYGGHRIDNATNHINYGFRDYDYSSGRFITSDPVRDGNNWFVFVNNDPINFIDVFGLFCQDTLDEYGKKPDKPLANFPLMPDIELFVQSMFAYTFGEVFSEQACAVTSLVNALVVAHYNNTREEIGFIDVIGSIYAAINNDSIRASDAFITDWELAATTISNYLGIDVSINYNNQNHEGDITIFAIDKNGDGTPDHFAYDIGNNYYFDPYDGEIKYMSDDLYATQGNGGTRDLDIY